ncbi:hypothetical protein [Mycolicibacterium frederiksbergense]|uniref:Uncharacterized protein n=1 Tax=Mycolicibacterium frederiksbergense TaxID=117567 RepID=A0A6H0RZN4_9MYCO|nr:hypothetical protein [Mycolicibacterium frederiksbergense]QIV79921.1 hypothetical protein EXE63_02635 [Mycolicibacterium frederiksbergense]
MSTDPTARDALDEARREIIAAREAAEHGDEHRRTQYARSAIDSAATTLLDPSASKPEVVAARFFLQEGLALDGRANSCGADSIHTDEEVSALSEDQQTWLRNYLHTQRDRQPVQAGQDAGIGISR